MAERYALDMPGVVDLIKALSSKPVLVAMLCYLKSGWSPF
jgi:hypothetical protein